MLTLVIALASILGLSAAAVLPTDPKLATNPVVATDPKLATDSKLATDPKSATDPKLATNPVIATDTVSRARPNYNPAYFLTGASYSLLPSFARTTTLWETVCPLVGLPILRLLSHASTSTMDGTTLSLVCRLNLLSPAPCGSQYHSLM
jgi:hypothetical protein